jgi:phosphonate transport system substrate-binding protein
MKISKSLTVFLLIGLSYWVIYAGQSMAGSRGQSRPVMITILPCADISSTYKKFYPLAVFLQNEIGSKVVLQVPRDWDELSQLISSGETDFVYQPPHVYVQMEEHYRKNEILTALSLRGERKNHGLLIVRGDSNINKVGDLRGKSLLFGQEFSTIKTVAGKALLQKHGINYEKDLLGYRYGGSCEEIALNVYLKAADAGFVCDHLPINLTSPPNKTWSIPPNSLRVIAETEEYHTWIFSALKSADAPMVSAVIRALLSLHENQNHQGVLKDIESWGFVPILESDLLILRKNFL